MRTGERGGVGQWWCMTWPVDMDLWSSQGPRMQDRQCRMRGMILQCDVAHTL
jgi:hypothetical protein